MADPMLSLSMAPRSCSKLQLLQQPHDTTDGCKVGTGATSAWVQHGLGHWPSQAPCTRTPPDSPCVLTCSTFSSLSSVKTVPSIWLGFSATQLKTGMRNLVWIGFFTFTAG